MQRRPARGVGGQQQPFAEGLGDGRVRGPIQVRRVAAGFGVQQPPGGVIPRAAAGGRARNGCGRRPASGIPPPRSETAGSARPGSSATPAAPRRCGRRSARKRHPPCSRARRDQPRPSACHRSRPLAPPCPGQQVVDGIVQPSGGRHTPLDAGDDDVEDRDSGGEICRSVHRIDDPDHRVRGRAGQQGGVGAVASSPTTRVPGSKVASPAVMISSASSSPGAFSRRSWAARRRKRGIIAVRAASRRILATASVSFVMAGSCHKKKAKTAVLPAAFPRA